jgi:hypothetical protein
MSRRVASTARTQWPAAEVGASARACRKEGCPLRTCYRAWRVAFRGCGFRPELLRAGCAFEQDFFYFPSPGLVHSALGAYGSESVQSKQDAVARHRQGIVWKVV